MKKPENYKTEIWSAALTVLFIIIVWLLSWLYIDKNIVATVGSSITDQEARGIFGDKFGAVNSLFAGLAFAGIIFTILLQRKELQLQRDELKSTREVFEKQNETMNNQKFENTYFQMLNLFHSIVNSLDIRRKDHDKGIISSGRDCFQTFYKQFDTFITVRINQMNNGISSSDPKFVRKSNLSINAYLESYEQLYTIHRSDLSHYFRTFYHIIKLIDKSSLENKNEYISIARAQLSSYEQILLFYNCLHLNGKQKFLPLIEKYGLFKNIDYSLLFDLDHKDEYKSSAFGVH